MDVCQEDLPSADVDQYSPDFTSMIEEMNQEHRQKLFLQLCSSIPKTDPSAAFSMIDCLIDEFVSSSGVTITIDKDFIGRFPSLDYLSLYRRIGRTTKFLTVSNITQEEAIALIPLFQNIESLVLEGMEIKEDNLVKYPTGVKILKLSQCYSNCRMLPESFERMFCSLESIHFDRFYCDKYEYKRGWSFSSQLKIRNIIFEQMETDLVQSIPHKCRASLESLTYKNTTGQILPDFVDDLPKLQRLIIQDCSGFSSILHIHAPALEYFSLQSEDLVEIPLVLSDDHPLKSLESVTTKPIRRIDNILKLTKLEHIKIHCEWYHAEELRNHLASLKGMVSYGVTSSSPSTIGYNLEQSVDRNSLRKIFSYLSEEDMRSISLVRPMFVSLLPWIEIDEEFVKKYPVANVNFYEEIGSQVRRLSIRDVNADQFNEIVPYFTNLKALSITCIMGQNSIDLDTIPLIEELSLYGYGFFDYRRSEQWISLFRRLNQNLKHLDFLGDRSNELICALNELKNLEVCKLSVDRFGEWWDLEFLKQNKNMSILCLETEDEDFCQIFFKILEDISSFDNAKNIRSLTLRRPEGMNHREVFLSLNRFENLEHLSLSTPLLLPLSIHELALNKINSVAVTELRHNIPRATLVNFIRHFPNLKSIKLNFETTLKRCWVSKFLEVLVSYGDSNYTPKFIDEYNVLLTR